MVTAGDAWLRRAIADAPELHHRIHRENAAMIHGNVLADGRPITSDTINGLMVEYIDDLFGGESGDAQ